MSSGAFKKANRSGRPVRLAIAGQSGSGKTLSALKLGRYLVGPYVEGNMSTAMCLIDSEHRTSDLFGMLPGETVEKPEEARLNFDMLDLTTYKEDVYPESPFSPQKYMDALDEAEAACYGVVIVDSLSHAWAGQGGLLDEVSDIAKATRKQEFAAWRDGSEIQTRLVNRILSFKNAHVICTMRTKMDYAMLSDEAGRVKSISRIGTVPVQGKGIHYEFDILLEGEDLTKNSFRVTKSRFYGQSGRVFERPGKQLADIMLKSLGDLDETNPDQGESVRVLQDIAPEAVVKGRNVVDGMLAKVRAKGIDAVIDANDTCVTVNSTRALDGTSHSHSCLLSEVVAGETLELTQLRATAKVLTKILSE